MAAFLEEVLPVNVRMGASYADKYDVEITTTGSGSEYRKLTQPFPVRNFHINFTLLRDDMAAKVLDLYHSARGMYAGFRVKCLDDFSTNKHVLAPTGSDWTLPLVSTGVYQLIKGYGEGYTQLSLGYSYRNIYKPVSGSAVLRIAGVDTTAGYSVDTTSGLLTLSTDVTGSITGITKASQAIISTTTVVNVGASVLITGVSGMTQLNFVRYKVTASNPGISFTIDVNSTAFSTYTSDGTFHTRPQTGEVVSGGCYFDIPCRFNSLIEVAAVSSDLRDCGGIDLIELINP